MLGRMCVCVCVCVCLGDGEEGLLERRMGVKVEEEGGVGRMKPMFLLVAVNGWWEGWGGSECVCVCV